ncbi:hypothetical protein MUP51_05805 [Candidatus Bathyarchaeota archaeon]|nr:hypothetical protein [Candidatus Bathyarchaeota archaeon]
MKVEKRSRTFLLDSIKYAIIAGIIAWTLREPRVLEFQIDYFDTATIDFSALRWPLLTLLVGFYLGKISESFFAGRWITPLRNSLRYLGVIGFIFLSLSSPNAPASLRFTSNIFLVGTGAMTLLHFMENSLGLEHRLMKYIGKSLRYLLLGMTGALMVSRIPEIAISGIDMGFLILGLLSAIVAFTGFFEGSLIKFAALIGETLGKRMRISFIALTLIVFYGSALRLPLIRGLGQSAGFVYFFEWMCVCLILFFSYLRLRNTLKDSTSDLKGNWTRHIQEMEKRSDTELEKWSNLVDGFIKEGEKNLLTLYIVELLRKNGVSLERIQVELSELMDWNEKEVRIGYALNEAQRKRLLEEQRGMMLDRVIERVQERIG